MRERSGHLLCSVVVISLRDCFLLLRLLVYLLYFLPLASLQSATNVPPKETVTVEKVFDFRNPLPRHLTCIPNTNQLFVYHVNQKPNVVYQWDISRKKLLKTYALGDGFICDDIRISPDGRLTVIACFHTYNFDTGRDFATKALLIDNIAQKVIRNVPIDDRIYDVKFSTNSQFFRVTTIFQKSFGFNVAGESIPHYEDADYQPPTNSRVWMVPNSKGRDPKTVGIFCRDDLGNEKHLHGVGAYDFVVTKDKFVATDSGGELIIWRLSDCQQIFKKRLSKNGGFVVYCVSENLILWADVDGSQLLGIRIR